MTIGALKRFLERPAPPPRPERERCEMCAQSIESAHSHLVNIENRRLLCVCRPCYLLFLPRGAAVGKIRTVPERSRHLAGFGLGEAAWAELQIPVRMAFFFTNSQLGKVVAFYPSPAGATESLLSLSAWDALVAANPVLTEMEPDVEALLVHAPRGGHFDCFLVPINDCYELVGRVRRTWRGFDGGEEAWAEIDGFFSSLRGRCAEVATP